MAIGTISDAADVRVMSEADVLVSINPETLTPQQIRLLLQQTGVTIRDEYRGQLEQGDDPRSDMADISLHLTIDEGLAALQAIGVIDSGEQPTDGEDSE